MRPQLPLLLACAALLAGCASLSADGGLGPVQQAARDHLGKDLVAVRDDADRAAVDARVQTLLQQPLEADAAVQLALLNHRGVQAGLQALAFAEAEAVQSARLPNPGFSFGRLTKGDEVERELGVHFSLARLLALPLLRDVAQRRVAIAQGDAAQAVLAHAADTRKAWIQAVAAEEGVRYAKQVMQAAGAGAELARRMAAVGNFSALQQAREQAFHADAALQLARAQQTQAASRERLTRLLGLWGEPAAAYRLPERLPALPAEPADQPQIEQLAMTRRLDVQAARAGAEQTAKNLGLTRATRFINVLELGLVRNTSNEAPVQRGFEVGFELPIFDGGGARVAQAEAVYRQALHRAAQTAIDARSEVREAYGRLRSTWDIARHHRDEIVPLRQRIAQENLLRYNGMFIGVFELVADARGQIASVNGAIEALRDFWLAQADMDMALIGKAGLGPMTSGASTAAAPAEPGH